MLIGLRVFVSPVDQSSVDGLGEDGGEFVISLVRFTRTLPAAKTRAWGIAKSVGSAEEYSASSGSPDEARPCAFRQEFLRWWIR